MPWYQASAICFVAGVRLPVGGVVFSATTLSSPFLTTVSGPTAAILTTSTLATGVEIETLADGSIVVIPVTAGSGGTATTVGAGTALDAGTVGGVALPSAFVSLVSTGMQTLEGGLTALGVVVPGRTATIANQGTVTLADAGATVFINQGTSVAQSAYLSAGLPKGFYADIIDDSMSASATNPLTISTAAGVLALIESPGGHARVFFNGTNWRFSS